MGASRISKVMSKGGGMMPKKSLAPTSEVKKPQEKNCSSHDLAAGYPAPLEVLGDFDEEQGLNFFEPISYKKLVKVIG